MEYLVDRAFIARTSIGGLAQPHDHPCRASDLDFLTIYDIDRGSDIHSTRTTPGSRSATR